jgi:UDP-glucose 4-epimerase
VLGGSGFIGSHLVEALATAGYWVRSFDARSQPIEAADSDRIEYVTGDFRDSKQVSKALAGCDYVFHLVSTTLPKTSNDDPLSDVRDNLLPTLALLDEAVAQGVKKILFLSSGGTIYGIPQELPITEDHSKQPLNSYGIVKLTIEHYLRLYHALHGLNYQVLRLSNPFGERQAIVASQGVIAVFMGKALKGEALEVWGDGGVIRDYIYISDVIDALLLALPYDGVCREINIGSGQGLSINQVIEAISSTIGRKIDKRHLPQRSFDVPASVLCIKKAKTELNWQPRVSFEDGLHRVEAWIRGMI